MTYNPFSLIDKTILVTGASSGIGRAVAIECSKLGAKVIITARNQARLNDTFDSLTGSGHLLIKADLDNSDSINELVPQVPKLDGIVNCAGIIKKLPLKFINFESLELTMHTNFFGPLLLLQKAVKLKKLNNSSSIVFISSIAAHIASFGSIEYMASKGALNSSSRGAALELAEKGIRVNVIEPGLIKTSLALSALTQEDLENYEKKYPLGRFGQPEEIAFGVIYFLSDASKWTTGTVLRIDGGITLR